MTSELADSAEAARRAHDYRSAFVATMTIWFPLIGSIGAWAVHLVLLTALVRISCTEPRWLWAMHGATVVTLAVTAATIVLSWRLTRPAESSPAAIAGPPRRFVGVLGLMFGTVNALLIVVEEILVLALRTRRCG